MPEDLHINELGSVKVGLNASAKKYRPRSTQVRYPMEANFLPGVFSPLTSEAC